MVDYIPVINIILVTHCLFLSFILIRKKANKKSNLLYSVFILIFSFFLIFNNVVTIKKILSPEAVNLSLVFLSLSLPFFYFYGNSITGQRLSIHKLLHFLPSLLILIYFIIRLIRDRVGIKHLFYDSGYFLLIRSDSLILIECILLIYMVYIILLIRALNKYRTRVKNYFSSIELFKLRWFRIHLYLGLLSTTSYFITNIINPVLLYYKDILWAPLEIYCVVTIYMFIFSMAYFVYMQPDMTPVFKQINDADFGKYKFQVRKDSSTPRYTKQRLDEYTEKKYLQKLIEYMKNEKPYTKADLTLQQLAEEVSVSHHQLTMILNLYLKKNYYNFINSYRVNEVCEKLASIKHSEENILTIAYNSGFNSKSTFNKFFKESTGMTPRQYREMKKKCFSI